MPVDYFHDRRKTDHLPRDDDYSTPMEPSAVAEANRRFRESGVPGVIRVKNRPFADDIVSETQKIRHRARRAEGKDFSSVGEYLEFLNSIPEE